MLSTIATSESRTGSTSIAPRRKEAVCVTSPRKSRSSSVKARLMADSAEPRAPGLLSITASPPGHKPARPSLCTAKRPPSSCSTTRSSQGPDQGLAGTGLLLMGNLDWRKWPGYWSNTHSSDQMREETFDESRQAIDAAPRDSGHNRNRGESRGGSHVQYCRGKQPVRRGSLRQAAEPAGEPVLLAQ